MKKRVRGLAAAALLALAGGAAAAVQQGRSAAGELEPGSWTGDIRVGDAAVGVRFMVTGSPSAPHVRLLSLDSHGIPSRDLVRVSVGPDVLHFELPGRQRRLCSLRRDRDTGGYGGACRGSGHPWRVRMLPPSAADAPTGRAAVLLSGEPAWDEYEQGWVRVHVPAGEVPAAAAQRVLASAVAGVASAQSLLGAPSHERRLRIFAIADRPAMQRLGGRPAGGLADPLAGTVLITGYGAPERALRHEIMHVLAVEAWGPPAPPAEWLMEGLATWAMRDCAGRDFDALARYLLDGRRLASFELLRDEFFRLDDLHSYVQSASLVGWVHREHGAAGVATLWRAGTDAGWRQLAGVGTEEAGAGAAALEAAWLGHLARVVPTAGDDDWAAIAAGGCDAG